MRRTTMPTIPERSSEDRALTAALVPIFDQYRHEAQLRLAARPSSDVIPGIFYERLRAAIASAAMDHLQRISAQSSDRLAEVIGVPISEDARAKAIDWAQQRASELADEFVQRTEQWIADVVARAQTSSDSAGVAAAAAVVGLGTVFSEGRAKSIAVTETTRAASAGETNAARQIERDYQVKVVAYWTVDETSNVCPICDRLHGKPQDEWEGVYPGGPPGHPGCACSLRFVVVGDLPRFSEN